MRLLMFLLLSTLSVNVMSVEFEAGNSGGRGGSPFYDNPPSDYGSIDSIRLCGGSIVDSVEVIYNDTSGNVYSYGKHGGNGGRCSTLYFWAGEYITVVSGRYGSKVDSLRITTNYGRTISKGGNGGFASFKYTGNSQFQIAGFKGRSGSVVDAIGVIYFKTY